MDQKIILLADDDSDDTEMFREALADTADNIVCHFAVNGRELLDKLEKLNEKPQLIFLDLNMPVMDGWQCLKMLKTDPRHQHIPVIMISTSSHQREMDMAIDQGALCYFVKPYNFKDLKQMLQTITANLGGSLKAALQNLQTLGSAHIFTCE